MNLIYFRVFASKFLDKFKSKYNYYRILFELSSIFFSLNSVVFIFPKEYFTANEIS